MAGGGNEDKHGGHTGQNEAPWAVHVKMDAAALLEGIREHRLVLMGGGHDLANRNQVKDG